MTKGNKPRVVVIANPSVPVPPVLYGGAERIIHYVNVGLQASGFTVDLIAGKGSQSYGGRLFLYAPAGLNILRRIVQRLKFYWASLMLVRGADLIINFGRVDYLGVFFRAKKQILNVFQNPITQFEIDYLTKRSDRVRLVAVSKDQYSEIRSPIPFHVIHNCADTTKLKFDRESNRSYFVFIGRLTRNKGVKPAITIARTAGIRLKIAGPIPRPGTEDYSFYMREVEPFIDNDQISYVGSVDDNGKNDLFAGAIAFLFPLDWKDPCPLTVSESLACGVPVIATRTASMPELIDHGKTGFLCESMDEFVSAIRNISSISNEYCRKIAEERFSQERLQKEYLALVNALTSGAALIGAK